MLRQNDMLLLAKENDDRKFVDLLSHQFTVDISFVDPTQQIFFSLPSLGSSNLSRRLQYKLVWVRAHVAIAESVTDHEISAVIINNGHPDELMELMKIYKDVRKTLEEAGLFSSDLLEHCYSLRTIAATKNPVEMDTYLQGLKYDRDRVHPLTKQFPFRDKPDCDLSHHVYLVITTEGYTDLVEFSLEHISGWTAEIELEMVRAASFLGHSSIVAVFLNGSKYTFCSNISERYYQAMLGAAEAGRCNELQHLALETTGDLLVDSIKDHTKNITSETEIDWDSATSLVCNSLVASTVSGYVTGNHSEQSIISMLIHKLKYTHGEVLHSMELVLISESYYADEAKCILRLLDLFDFVLNEFGIMPIQHQRQIRTFTKLIIKFVRRGSSQNLPENFFPRIIEWLGTLIMWVDIQDLDSERFIPSRVDIKTFCHYVCQLKEKQRDYWSQFDVVKQGQPLAQVQHSISSGTLTTDGYDRGGLLLTHLAAAYGRVDILEWLVTAKGLDLGASDGTGRTPQQVAEAAKAISTYTWIAEFKASKTIADFITRNHERIKAIQKHQGMVRKVIFIQKMVRGYFTRKLHCGALLLRLEESQRFQAIWAPSLQLLPNEATELFGWEAVRSRTIDINNADALDAADYSDTIAKLDKALAGALLDESEEGKNEEQARPENNNDFKTELPPIPAKIDSMIEAKWSNMFQVTSHVVKFLKSGDPLYRSFFVRRMQQLANGDRSRILQKRLKGSQTMIWETYLEQKSGFRILWTEESGTIVVWFVAKHKSVSRLMKLIDDAKSRSARQQIPESLLEDSQEDNTANQTPTQEKILLDIGNAPLKLYDLSFHDLDDVAQSSWAPQMHLTEEERNIVEAEGTVLLLGRSGTGKTICICNRMEFDRQRFGHDPSFSQLFVSRSSRLCKFVKEAVGVGPSSNKSFMTFRELIYNLESTLPTMENERRFTPSQHVDFYRFSRDFYNEIGSLKGKPSPLIAWKTIQSFIKGSIEGWQNSDHVLARDYFVSGKLGKNRCRLDSRDCDIVYDIFLEYQKYIQSKGLWDNCDRVVSLLTRLQQAKMADPSVYEKVRKSKVYVDEIQDYTQIECLLYFYLGGPGGLFLAGDSAQSVVEGTDFRFEEVRSVGYYVAGDGRRDLIPKKPKTVNVNFRSHSGILNTGAALLSYLFTYFPQSAKQLQKDHGLFQGPRPGVCYNVGHRKIAALLRGKLNGVIVLTHDDSSLRWKRALDYPLVYGIREAKGLEFKRVIILDFFCELPTTLQKPWRDLVLDRADVDFQTRHPIVENILKLLYTAVTRSIEQLYFVETSSSIAGDATLRWLTTTTTTKRGRQHRHGALATLINVSNLDSMSMTCDEWISSGIDNAEMAEDHEIDLKDAVSLLDRSVYCFEQAQFDELAAKARAHRQSVHFRSALVGLGLGESSSTKNDLAMVEKKAAQLLETLLREDLLREAILLIESIFSLISSYTRDELEKKVLPKLQLARFFKTAQLSCESDLLKSYTASSVKIS